MSFSLIADCTFFWCRTAISFYGSPFLPVAVFAAPGNSSEDLPAVYPMPPEASGIPRF